MTNQLLKAPTMFLASLLSLASVATASDMAMAAVAAPAPVVSSGPGLLIGHGVNDFGGTFDVIVIETPWFTFGFFSYVRSNGLAYGGPLDCICVNGDDAYFSGEITFGDDPGVGTPPLGFGVMGKVTDNGPGGQDTQAPFIYNPTGPVPGFCEIPGAQAFIDTAPTLTFLSGDMLVNG